MYQPMEHEKTVNIKPIGVKRICEHCGEGEMVRDHSQEFKIIGGKSVMIPHVCTKCGGTLLFDKIYPYIEWLPEEE